MENASLILILILFTLATFIGFNIHLHNKCPTVKHMLLFEPFNFQSPKSAIKNFNDTGYDSIYYPNLPPIRNNLKPFNSILTDHYQPRINWIYPYTFINRAFDQILIALCHQIEKDFNNNQRLHDRNNWEWRQSYPYQIVTWEQTTSQVKNYLDFVIGEINRRFNTVPPIVGFRPLIKQYWIKPSDLILRIKVYKKYTIDDIKYYDGFDPTINDHLKSDFETELVIYIDDIDQYGGFHLKYLRFPKIDYENDDTWDDLPSINQYDHNFYLALSNDAKRRIPSNQQVHQLYNQQMNIRQDRLHQIVGTK